MTDQRFKLHDLISFPGQYTYPNNRHNVDREYYEICSYQIDETIKSISFKGLVMVLSFFVASAWPMYLFFTYGIKSTMIQAKIPFANENSNVEFLGNFSLECMLCSYGILAYIGLEIAVAICTDYLSVSRSFLEHRLYKLLNQHQKHLLKEPNLFESIKNIVHYIQEFDE